LSTSLLISAKLLFGYVSCTSARFAKLILRTTLVAYNFADPRDEGETILGKVGTPYPSSRPNLAVGLNFQHLCYENLQSRHVKTLILLRPGFMLSILDSLVQVNGQLHLPVA
jgi:hypothetical protein